MYLLDQYSYLMVFFLSILLIQYLHHLWNNEVPESLIIRRIIMSDEAVDIYPLTVEEYESAEVIAQDVEVE